MDRPGSGLRRLIGLLLVLNLGVLAYGLALEYWRGHADPPLAFNGDKIRLMAEFRPESPVRASAPAPRKEQAPAAAISPASRCLAWRGLDADGLAQVEARLAAAGIPVDAYDLVLAEKLGWWVFLPPLDDVDALRAAVDAMRAKGVTDLAAVRAGSMVNAISLGVFPNLSRARAHAAKMAAKGISGVRYGPRPGAGAIRLTFDNQVAADVLVKLGGQWPRNLKPETCPAE